jgi:hypothetical protein
MGRQSIRTILAALCLAIPLLFMTFRAGQAQTAPDHPDTTEEQTCQSCHGDTFDDWAQSMHGRATDNRAFLLEWKRQGSSPECMSCHTTGYDPHTGDWAADGITCEVCHGPAPDDHPQSIMPTNDSASDCGSCHVDTHIQWQVSEHGHNDLTCDNCHNPHTTELKTIDSQSLCRSCHNQESHFYEETAHAQVGLLCVDCHLRYTDASAGEGHGNRIHTFGVDLRSCTQCHGAEMHYPVQNAMLPHQEEVAFVQTDDAIATPSHEPLAASMVTDPAPASGINYILAVSVGLGLGIIIAPGIDHLYRRLSRNR